MFAGVVLPVASSLGAFTSAAQHLGATEMATAARTADVGEIADGKGYLSKTVPFFQTEAVICLVRSPKNLSLLRTSLALRALEFRGGFIAIKCWRSQ